MRSECQSMNIAANLVGKNSTRFVCSVKRILRLHAGIARVQIHTALSALASRIHRVGTDRPQLPQEEVAEAAAEVHAGHADIKQNGGHLTAILLYLSRLCGFFFFSAFRKSSVQGFDIFLYKE